MGGKQFLFVLIAIKTVVLLFSVGLVLVMIQYKL